MQNPKRLQQTHGKSTCLRRLKQVLAEKRAEHWIQDYPKPLKTCTSDFYSLCAKFGSGVIKVNPKDWARPVKQTSGLKSFLCGLPLKLRLWAEPIAVCAACLGEDLEKGRSLGSNWDPRCWHHWTCQLLCLSSSVERTHCVIIISTLNVSSELTHWEFRTKYFTEILHLKFVSF